MRISCKALGAIWAVVLAIGLGGGIPAHADCTGNVFSSGDFESGLGTGAKAWIKTPLTSAVIDTSGKGKLTPKTCAVFQPPAFTPPVPPVPAGDLELRYNVSLKQPNTTITETLTFARTTLNFAAQPTLYLWMQTQAGGAPGTVTVTVDGGAGLNQVDTFSPPANWSTPHSIPLTDTAFQTASVTVVIKAVTSTDTDTPSLFLLGAAEFSDTPLSTPTAAALPFNSASYAEDSSVAVVSGYAVPKKFNDPALGFAATGNNIYRFGGIGYPTVACNLTTIPGSSGAVDHLLVVSSTTTATATDPLVKVGEVAASDTASTTKCAHVTTTLTAMPFGKVAFRSTIAAQTLPATSTVFLMDNVSMTYACKALTDLFAAATPSVPVPEVLSDGDFEGTGTVPWQTAAPLATTQSIVVTTADACSTTHAAVFEALRVPEITLSQKVDVPLVPGVLTFYLSVPAGNGATDTFDCLVKTSAGTSTVLLDSTSGPGSGSYGLHSITLGASYLGQTGVTFTFRARFGSGLPAQFSLDDVCLVSAIASISDWTYSVSPFVIGPGQSATVLVSTLSGNLAGMNLVLRMMPEIPQLVTVSTQPYINYPLVVDPNNTGAVKEAVAKISFDGPFNPAADGPLICTDGAPNFMLLLDGNIVPGPLSNPPVPTLPTPLNKPLIIDTVAPELYVSGPNVPYVTANDSSYTNMASPPTALGSWPGDYIPSSSGVGTLANADLYWFIGYTQVNGYTPSTNPVLTMQVHAQFADRFPTDANGIYSVTPSGFDTANALMIGGGVPTYVSPDPTVGGVVLVLPPVYWQFEAAGPCRWALMPGAQDRALNKSVIYDPGSYSYKPLDHTINAWYLDVPVAVLESSSTTSNTQTVTPRFDWSLRPSTGLTWNQENPCRSQALFQIWTLDPATGAPVYLTSDWVLATGPIVPQTFVSSTMTVGDLLALNRSNASQSHQLFIRIAGANEAGNIQQGNFATATWINGTNQGNVAVDTDLGVRLSHVNTNGDILAGRDFGGMERVPLPSFDESLGLGAHVQGIVSMAVRYPVAAVGVQVNWKLYEDGTLVALGSATPGNADQPMSFTIPDLLRIPYQTTPVTVRLSTCTVVLDPAQNWGAFLRVGPDGVQNRLGDEGKTKGLNRQREVRYTLVAQTVATIPDATTGIPLSIVDPTPASAEFSIYVRDMQDKAREEQPVRIYERK